MKASVRLTVAVILALWASGCASSNKVARQEATARWQKVRADVTRQMARQQLEKGQLEQAEGTLRDALRANPQDAQLHLLMVRVRFEQRDLNGAQAEAAAARRLAPDLADVDYWQGVLAQAAGQWEEAHAAYQVACNKSRTSPEYLYALLEAKLTLGRYEEAAELACGRFHDFPRDARLRLLAGGALAMKGDLDQAEAVYEQAASLDPASNQIKERLAQVLCEAGQWERAATLLEAVLSTTAGRRDDLRQMLATCHLRSGRYDAAVKAYEACLVDNPDSTSVSLKLMEARLLAGQVSRACQELRDLLEQRPKEAGAWELLGHAYALQDEWGQAQQAYARAAQCGGDAGRLREYTRAIQLRGKVTAAQTLGDSTLVAKRTNNGSDH
jgi:Tfp pilus assembly protein PilF